MRASDFFILILLAGIWGSSFLLMRVATPEFGPWGLIGVRMGLGALCLLPILRDREARVSAWQNWLPLSLSGLFSSGLPFVLLSYATLHLSAGFTSLMNGSVPLFSAVIAAVWLGEPLGRARIFGLLLGLVGLIVLIGDKLNFDVGGSGLAVCAAVLACVLYGYGASFIKRYLTHLKPKIASVGSLIGASLLLVPLGAINAPELMPSATAWWCAILLAAVCTGFAFVLFFGLLQRVGPTSATSVAFLIPIFGVFWGWLILDEAMTTRMFIGMVLSLVGTTFVTGVAPTLIARLKRRT